MMVLTDDMMAQWHIPHRHEAAQSRIYAKSETHDTNNMIARTSCADIHNSKHYHCFVFIPAKWHPMESDTELFTSTEQKR